MNNSIIYQFAEEICRKNSISEENVKKIFASLDKKELKLLARALKTKFSRKVLSITSAEELTQKEKNDLQSKFLNMHIKYLQDKNMGAGIKLQAFDMLYDLSLKGRINGLANKLEGEII